MRETLAGIRRVSERYKTFAALGLIFVCGFLLSMGLSTMWYEQQINERIRQYEISISRLQFELDISSSVNRSELGRVAAEAAQIAVVASQTAAQIEVLMRKIDEVAGNVKAAANKANQAAAAVDDAAVTVKDAASKAAKALE